MLASDERGPTDPNELSPVSYWPSPSVSDQVKTLMKLECSPNPRGLPCPAASPASVSVSGSSAGSTRYCNCRQSLACRGVLQGCSLACRQAHPYSSPQT